MSTHICTVLLHAGTIVHFPNCSTSVNGSTKSKLHLHIHKSNRYTYSLFSASNVSSRIIEHKGLSIDDRLILAIIPTFLLTLVVGVSIGVLSVLAGKKCKRSEKITLKTETEMRPPPGEQENTKPDPHTHGNLAYGHVHSFKQ